MTLDAGHAQITVGLAWWYRAYAKEQSPEDQGAYEFSEQEAKAKRVGLWRDPEPSAAVGLPKGEARWLNHQLICQELLMRRCACSEVLFPKQNRQESPT